MTSIFEPYSWRHTSEVEESVVHWCSGSTGKMREVSKTGQRCQRYEPPTQYYCAGNIGKADRLFNTPIAVSFTLTKLSSRQTTLADCPTNPDVHQESIYGSIWRCTPRIKEDPDRLKYADIAEKMVEKYLCADMQHQAIFHQRSEENAKTTVELASEENLRENGDGQKSVAQTNERAKEVSKEIVGTDENTEWHADNKNFERVTLKAQRNTHNRRNGFCRRNCEKDKLNMLVSFTLKCLMVLVMLWSFDRSILLEWVSVSSHLPGIPERTIGENEVYVDMNGCETTEVAASKVRWCSNNNVNCASEPVNQYGAKEKIQKRIELQEKAQREPEAWSDTGTTPMPFDPGGETRNQRKSKPLNWQGTTGSSSAAVQVWEDDTVHFRHRDSNVSKYEFIICSCILREF